VCWIHAIHVDDAMSQSAYVGDFDRRNIAAWSAYLQNALDIIYGMKTRTNGASPYMEITEVAGVDE
jgi:hypothetical protein